MHGNDKTRRCNKARFLKKTRPIYGPLASRLGHKSMEKTSVRNLQYGQKTRLIRGIYFLHYSFIK